MSDAAAVQPAKGKASKPPPPPPKMGGANMFQQLVGNNNKNSSRPHLEVPGGTHRRQGSDRNNGESWSTDDSDGEGSSKIKTSTFYRTTLDPETISHLEVLKSYAGVSILRIYGINQYQHGPEDGGLPNLGAAREDGQLIEQVLGPMFSEVQSRYDADVTKTAIERDLADLAKRFKKPSVVGRLYIMFAGHGIEDDYGAYFCTHETQVEDLMGTAFPLERVKNYMKRIGIKHQVIVMDSCYSGGLFLASRARDSEWEASMASKPAIYGMTAVSAGEEAIEQNGHGLFTKHVADALGGDVFDSYNRDYATLTEVFAFVQKRVFADAKAHHDSAEHVY